MQEIHLAQLPLHAEFSRRGGWTRFYAVEDGHIHSSMHCRTCNNGRERTRFGWMPELSGQTEEQALATLDHYQHMLCSVCYPSAPVEWYARLVRQDPSKCTNRRVTGRGGNGMSEWGNCEVCGARGVRATAAGLVKHTNARYALEAARAARLADPKLVCTPEGDVLRVDLEDIKTVVTARSRYAESVCRGRVDDARVLLEAVARKAGVSVDEMAVQLAKNVAAYRKRNY